VRFAVSPTIKTFYVEIRIDKPGSGDGATDRSRAESTATTDEEKEGEPLLRRTKEDNAGAGGTSSSSSAAPGGQPAATYGTQPADIDIDLSADGLDGLD
jgi:hypothetical protein